MSFINKKFLKFTLILSIIGLISVWLLFGERGFIHLKKHVALAIAFILILGHNLLDGFQPATEGAAMLFWNMHLHVIVLEYRDGRSGNPGKQVTGSAAGKVDDPSLFR